MFYSWPSHTILLGWWQNLYGLRHFDLGNIDWYIFQQCKTLHRLYVIEMFTNNWFSKPLVSNSLPTNENRVGGIFIIGIIKQNAVFLAIFCNCAQKCYYTLQQQCSVIQVLHLDNTWTRGEAMGVKESHCPCMGMICIFCLIILQVE